jgi:hypothetical protein
MEGKLINPKLWIKQLRKITSTALERFPLTISLLAALAILLIYDVTVPYEYLRDYRDVLDRLYASLAVAITLSMAAKVLLERLGKSEKEGFFTGIFVIAFSVFYFFFLIPEINMITMIRVFFTNAVFLLSFLFIPYLIDRKNFEIYIADLMAKAAVAIFFMVVLGAGVSALIFSIEALLIEDLSSDFYAYTWIITVFVFAPTYFFYSMPKYKDELTKADFAKPIKVALIYLVLPLLTAYTIVLYLYFARILITWDWPSGIVSYLVSSYAAIGLVSIFLVWPFRNENKWVDSFIKVYTKVIYPLLGMMFIAIYLRINQYGFTENRYFIVAIGSWATFAITFINIDKGKRNTILVASLALTLLIASYGPLSATSVAIRSQNNRFESILERNEMIENGEIVPNSDIPDIDKREITRIINYFNYDYDTKYLNYVPENFNTEMTEEIFGFPHYGWDIEKPTNRYFSFNGMLDSFVLSDYDLLIPIMHYRYGDPFISEEILFEDNIYHIQSMDNRISLHQNGLEIIEFELIPHAESLIDTYGMNKYDLTSEELSFEVGNEVVSIKIIYTNLSGSFGEEGQGIEEINTEGYLLVDILE